MKDLDDFFLKNDEATNACFMALKDIILKFDPEISFSWKYGMPFLALGTKCFVIYGPTKRIKINLI